MTQPDSIIIFFYAFTDSESRRLLLPTCCEHVKLHLLAKEELKLCSDILGEIISFLYSAKNHSQLTTTPPPVSENDNNENSHSNTIGEAIDRDVYILVDILMQPLMQSLMGLEKEILSTVTVSIT